MALADLRDQSTRRLGDELLAHLNSFELELKFSAGIWYFTPALSRFHAKYQPDLTIEQRLDIAATLADAGLQGVEAHYPNEVNEDNLDLWKSFSDDTGIKLITIIPQLFWDEQFEWGSLSNPIKQVRDAAIRITHPKIAVE